MLKVQNLDVTSAGLVERRPRAESISLAGLHKGLTDILRLLMLLFSTPFPSPRCLVHVPRVQLLSHSLALNILRILHPPLVPLISFFPVTRIRETFKPAW